MIAVSRPGAIPDPSRESRQDRFALRKREKGSVRGVPTLCAWRIQSTKPFAHALRGFVGRSRRVWSPLKGGHSHETKIIHQAGACRRCRAMVFHRTRVPTSRHLHPDDAALYPRQTRKAEAHSRWSISFPSQRSRRTPRLIKTGHPTQMEQPDGLDTCRKILTARGGLQSKSIADHVIRQKIKLSTRRRTSAGTGGQLPWIIWL